MSTLSNDVLGFDVSKSLEKLRTEGAGLPPHTYTSAEIFDLESREIFAKSWTCFAPLEKLKAPGSVVVGDVGRVPILVTRSGDGELHGFVNACRHRGYPVATEDKSDCKKLTCRYHSWTYRLDGSLVVAPESDPGLDKSAHGLLPVSVTAWAQFVFVNPDPDAAPLMESLCGLQDVADKFGLLTDVDSYDLVDVTEVRQQANWKLWWDNNTECYHCATIHGTSFAAAFQSSAEGYTLETHGLFTTTAVLPKQNDNGERASVTIHIYPGCFIVQQKDMMVMGRVVPHGPDDYTVYTYYFAEKGADPKEFADWLTIWKQTFDEDKEALQLQQHGLRSGRTKPFRYVSAREAQPIHHVTNTLLAYKSTVAAS